MLQGILAVVSLAIQRGLMILEDRQREREKGGLKNPLAAHADKLQQREKACDDKVARAKSLEAELSALKAKRDAAAKEQSAAQQSVTELKEQLSAKADTMTRCSRRR